MVAGVRRAVRSRDAACALPAPAGVLPTAVQLAALGPVLCAHRAADAPLQGWSRAVRAAASCGIDSDGLEEALLFFDRAGRCCWRLHLLPDSDFLAWDALCAVLPAHVPALADHGLGDRLWQRLAGRLRGDRWRCSVLCLHAVGAHPRHAHAVPGALALSSGALTPTGLHAAQRIARALDAEDAALREDCCCLQAARQAPPREPAPAAFPVIRFDPGEQA